MKTDFNLIFQKTLILLLVFSLCLTGCSKDAPTISSDIGVTSSDISAPTVSSSVPNGTTSIPRPYSVPSSSSEISSTPSTPYSPTTSTPVELTPITVLIDRVPTSAEKKAVEKFEKEYNASVNFKITQPKFYLDELNDNSAVKPTISVVCFDFEQLPTFAAKHLKSISSYYLQDECWETEYLNYFKINKKVLGLATRGSWMCEDKNYLLYYDTDVLKSAGITAMPDKLYSEGKWNWETQKQMFEKLKAKQITPLMLDFENLIMLSAGADFVGFNNGSYSNNLKNPSANSPLIKSWLYTAELKQKYYIAEKTDIAEFNDFKVGFYAAPAYHMHKERSEFTNLSDKRAVPLAGPTAAETYIPFSLRYWGIPKKCPEERLAIQFIHFMLNLENNPVKGTFANSQFETIYNKMVSKSTKRKINYSYALDYTEKNGCLELCTTLSNTSPTPSDMVDAMKTQFERVESAVYRIKKDLPRIK